jgi:hypothetical protein
MPITDHDLAYLLKELEIQFEIESKARDRAEQMVQYLLTTMAAIIAGTLILVQAYSLQVLFFFASLLIFISSVTSFYRTCRLRNIITQTRLARHLIRIKLEAGDVKYAFLLVGIDQEQTGFSNRMRNSLRLFALTCGALGGLVFFLGGIYLIEECNLFPYIYEVRLFTLVPLSLVIAIGIGYVLIRVIKNFQQISEKLIQDHDIPRE